MTLEEQRRYFDWFVHVVPLRVEQLVSAVHDDPAYASWTADGTRDSFEVLGMWFASHIEGRARTTEELDTATSKLPYFIEASAMTLTERTISLAIDVGIYLCQALRRRDPDLEFVLKIGERKNADFGQPVLAGFDPDIPLNPARIGTTLAFSLFRKSRGASRLLEIYDYWSGRVSRRQAQED